MNTFLAGNHRPSNRFVDSLTHTGGHLVACQAGAARGPDDGEAWRGVGSGVPQLWPRGLLGCGLQTSWQCQILPQHVQAWRTRQ